MLYVQCARCASIGPLVCSGQMWPHVTMPFVPTVMGPTCPGCGTISTGFMCPMCGTRQYLLQPGVPPPASSGGGYGSAMYAPVVQAKQGASHGSIRGLFEELGKAAVTEATSSAMNFAFGRYNG